jgi:galactokinase
MASPLLDGGLAGRLDLAWELRLVSYAYSEEFGHPPSGVWQAPGTVTLLADEAQRLTVQTRWGSIVAAGPRSDEIVEPVHMNYPGERTRLTVGQAMAGAGPSWAGTGLRSARQGASLLVNTDLPDGAGVGATTATQTAIALALRELPAPGQPALAVPAGHPETDGDPAGTGSEPGAAMLGGRPVPFGLDAAGLRLMVIDTRVRAAPQAPAPEHAPVEAAAAALAAGAFEALGQMMTTAHASLPSDGVQDIAVSAALAGGALGARMIVDGPGRPACALVPAGRLADVRAEVIGAFARNDLRSPRFLTVSPAHSARRAA